MVLKDHGGADHVETIACLSGVPEILTLIERSQFFTDYTSKSTE